MRQGPLRDLQTLPGVPDLLRIHLDDAKAPAGDGATVGTSPTESNGTMSTEKEDSLPSTINILTQTHWPRLGAFVRSVPDKSKGVS